MGEGGQTWVSKTNNVLDILPYSVSTIGPTMVGTRRRWRENGIFELVFANAVFYKSAILLIFEVESTESVLDIFSYPETTQGPAVVGVEEKFSK